MGCDNDYNDDEDDDYDDGGDGGGGRRRRANMLYDPTLQYQCLKTIMSCNVQDYPMNFYYPPARDRKLVWEYLTFPRPQQ